LGWSIFAKVPLRASGIGILLPNEQLRAIKSLVEGNVVFLFEAGKSKSPSYGLKLFNFSQAPDKYITDDYLFSVISDLQDLRKRYTKAQKNFDTFDFPRQRLPKGTLLAIVDPSNENTFNLRNSWIDYKNLVKFNQKSIEAEQVVLASNQIIYNSKSQILAKMKNLENKSYVSRNSVLNYQAELNQTQNQIQASRLNIVQNHVEIDKSRNNLVLTVRRVLQNTVLFAQYDLYIMEMNTSNFSLQRPGDTLMTVSKNPLTNPDIIPVFFSNTEAGKIGSGMKVLVTPAGLNRAEVGGIKGQMQFIDTLPSTPEYIQSLIGLSGGADLILKRVESPTVGSLRLFKSKISPYNYQWSSGTPQDIKSLKGDILNVDVTTGYTRPIALVIPFFREFFGIVPPKTKVKVNTDATSN
jgi:hypothetical protein